MLTIRDINAAALRPQQPFTEQQNLFCLLAFVYLLVQRKLVIKYRTCVICFAAGLNSCMSAFARYFDCIINLADSCEIRQL